MINDPKLVAKRICHHIGRRGPDECWNWTGRKNSRGYGQIRIGGRDYLAQASAAHLFACYLQWTLEGAEVRIRLQDCMLMESDLGSGITIMRTRLGGPSLLTKLLFVPCSSTTPSNG